MRTTSITQAPNGELAFNIDTISRDKSIEERGGGGKFEISIFEKIKVPKVSINKLQHIPISENFKYLSNLCSVGFPNGPIILNIPLKADKVEHLIFENNIIKKIPLTTLEASFSKDLDVSTFLFRFL